MVISLSNLNVGCKHIADSELHLWLGLRVDYKTSSFDFIAEAIGLYCDPGVKERVELSRIGCFDHTKVFVLGAAVKEKPSSTRNLCP